MSGFIGYMTNKQSKLEVNEKKNLVSMMETINHRGPDGSGFYADDYLRLGFRSLNTIDLVQNHQPLSYEDNRYWIVFDGIIYNYIELREQLENKGFMFKTKSDTEVLLALYVYKQESALDDLRGMFSFLIWDKRDKVLFGARDPFGIKPFYFMENNETELYCTSELKSLHYLITNNEDGLNLESLQHYFSYQYVPEPQTMQRNIHKLQPGYFFRKKPNQTMRMKAYFQPAFTPKKYSMDMQIKKIRDVLQESVSLHVRSDVPVGAFLSGGVDSSAIVAFAKEINPSITTFTVGFQDKGYSEIDVAKKTAEQIGVENNHYVISPQEFIHVLPDVIKHMDDPIADPAAVPLYIAAREAKKQVKVVLSGEGADELFGGYNIYREPGALNIFTYIPKSLQTMLRTLAMHLPEGVRGKSFLERGTSSLEDRFIGNAKLFSESEKMLLLKNYQYDFHYKKITQPLYNQVSHYPDVHKMQYIDLCTWARGDILVKADRMSMAHGLELRTPFFDRKVFNVASELLPEQTIAKRTTKYALREALRGTVPNSILYNKKLGFPVPIRHWLQNELFDWAKTMIKNSPTDEFIHKPYVFHLLEAHQLGKVDYSRRIWAVLVFIIWYQLYMEKDLIKG